MEFDDSMASFPKSFKFGWSQSGFQSEMGGPNSVDRNTDWFKWVHDKKNLESGLLSCDFPENGIGYWRSYRKMHGNAKMMGLDIARIGIEWSRIFPKPTFKIKLSGNTDKTIRELGRIADKEAVAHYRQIFEDLKSKEIKLILNIYHWSMPLWMHDPVKVRDGKNIKARGWLNRDIVEEFAKYALYCCYVFDDLVDRYATMNEPNIMNWNGYRNPASGFPPGKSNKKYFRTAFSNMAKAHRAAFINMKKITDKPVGLVYEYPDFTPLVEGDRVYVEKGWLSGFSFVDSLARSKRYRPALDWLGINYYSRVMIHKYRNSYRPIEGYGFRCKPDSFSLDKNPSSNIGWEVYPQGLHNVIMRCWKRWRLPIYITENGIADKEDRLRVNYLASHLFEVNRAISDKAKVEGYLHWSLADNYEWAKGFLPRFGLLQVDYKAKRLIMRPSAKIYAEIAKSHKLHSPLKYANI